MEEWKGRFSFLCCCRLFLAYFQPPATGIGKKQASPTCWVNGHRPILDRWAVGPWTYTGVRSHFHLIGRVWFEAVEHIAGQAWRQVQFSWYFSSAGFLIDQSVFRNDSIPLCQHRWRPGQQHRAACYIRAFFNLRVSTRRILRYAKFCHGFFPEASSALGCHLEEVRGSPMYVVHRVPTFLRSKFQCGQRGDVLSAKLEPVTLQIHAIGQVWRVPVNNSRCL